MYLHPYARKALQYVTITLVIVMLTVAAAAILQSPAGSSVQGFTLRTGQPTTIPTVSFDAERFSQGFTAPADTHVIFTIPDGIRITRIAALGGIDFDQNTEYWGYEFSGHEARNKADGKRGMAVYDGKFFYSLAARKKQAARPAAPADNDLVGILDSTTETSPQAKASIGEIFTGGSTYYLMTSKPLPVGPDGDGDGLDIKREQDLGTNPYSVDTDRDGISDDVEVLGNNKTNPLVVDSDEDGLPDGLEDPNHNGKTEFDETDPMNPDTDGDKLCDGDGYGNRCPEMRQKKCSLDPKGIKYCEPSSPIHGEDKNRNGIVDKGETDPRKPNTYGIDDVTYVWNVFQSQDANRNVKRGPGTDAPAFPIPALPQSQ